MNIILSFVRTIKNGAKILHFKCIRKNCNKNFVVVLETYPKKYIIQPLYKETF